MNELFYEVKNFEKNNKCYWPAPQKLHQYDVENKYDIDLLPKNLVQCKS